MDAAAGELRRNGSRRKLQEQPFQVLLVLLESAGQVVSREELQQRVWGGDTFVDFDNSLSTAINKIRHALGDCATAPRFVETVPRQGYRFIGQGGDSAHDRPSDRRIWRWVMGFAVGGAICAAALALVANYRRDVTPSFASPVPLTHYPGGEWLPSFSPDGSQIVFSWDGGKSRGQLDLFVQVVGDANPARLTEVAQFPESRRGCCLKARYPSTFWQMFELSRLRFGG